MSNLRRKVSNIRLSESSSDDDKNVEDGSGESEPDAEADSASEYSDTESEDDDVLYSIPDASPFVAKSGMNWERLPPDSGKTRTTNVFQGKPGVADHVPEIVITVEDSFSLFITPGIRNLIITFTNERGNTLVEGEPWRDVDEIEFDAFLGLLLLHGVYRESKRGVHELWHITKGRPLYNATMSGNRFTDIIRALRFDPTDPASRKERQLLDKLAPIRELFDTWVSTLKGIYVPGPYLTVDEQLYPFRGRCAFKQYIPNKPSKYGLKEWLLADSRSNFCLNVLPYTGKSAQGIPEKNQGRRVVLELIEPYGALVGRNVTCDNFFTDVALAVELLQRGFTITGTIRKNKTDIPSAFLPDRNREVFSTVFGFTKDLTLASYVPKKGKAVLVLSSMHHDGAVSETTEKKPEIILTYNHTKAGVDTVDQLVARYTVKRKSNRWPMVLFYDIVDLSASNGFIVWTAVNPAWKEGCKHRRRLYLIQLGEALLRRQLQRKLMDTQIVEPVKDFIRSVLDIKETTVNTPESEKKRRRCEICPREKDRKTNKCCYFCRAPCCVDHSREICVQCIHCKKIGD